MLIRGASKVNWIDITKVYECHAIQVESLLKKAISGLPPTLCMKAFCESTIINKGILETGMFLSRLSELPKKQQWGWRIGKGLYLQVGVDDIPSNIKAIICL